MAKLYNSFRINATRRLGGGAGFFALTEMKFFSGENGTGTQLLVGGMATASSFFGAGFEPEKAFDNNPSTRWSSASASSAWLRYDINIAVAKPKSIYLILNSNAEANAPVDFFIEASIDGGATWEVIYSAYDFGNAAEFIAGITKSTRQMGLAGIATISNATPVKRVMIYDWLDGSYVGKTNPDLLGNWIFTMPRHVNGTQYLVVFTGDLSAFNIRPQAHGPVTAKPLE